LWIDEEEIRPLLKVDCRWHVIHLLNNTEQMDYTRNEQPDHECLFGVASTQQGYFTTAQARACGFDTNLISYHKQRGRFIPVLRGVYRLRDYPSSNRGDVVAAWLSVGRDVAVVSHESALDLLDLSDVIPTRIHLTVPRSMRYAAGGPGVVIHTTTTPLRPEDVNHWEGVRVTSATRTILDAAEWGTSPEQIEMAIHEAISRGIATQRRLRESAAKRPRYVRKLVNQTLDWIESKRAIHQALLAGASYRW
jgi:predicted transcriptional regulator of viral defense system